MDLIPRSARPDALAPTPPPLRLLQPWAPAALRAASRDTGAARPAARGWLRRLLDLLHPRTQRR